MNATDKAARVGGFWYLLLILIGPLRLLYIPNKLFVHGDAAATVNNISAHQWLFRFGMVSELIGAIVLVLLGLAFYHLFEKVDRKLAVQVVIFGGVMPALLYLINVASDFGALTIIRSPDFLSAFDKPQRDALVTLLLHHHGYQNAAAEILWSVWLFPLAILVYRSRFLPRFLGVWVFIAGCAWLILCFIEFLVPQYQDKAFTLLQPAVFGEIALTLWLVIKGAKAKSTAASHLDQQPDPSTV
jgi:hypothetical protein